MHITLTSAWVITEHGVPQRSVLGPLLFLIYINYLARVIRVIAKPILFADDTSVIISNKDVYELKNKFDFYY
jgi:hypothetical protein